MKRRNFIIGSTAAVAVGGCKPDYPRASVEEARAAFYYAGPPYHISLESMVRKTDQDSEHAGLLINGSQRVLYDPAGNYWTNGRPRRLDIHYGMNDAYVNHYESFHARFDYFVERQTVVVSREIADLAIRKSEERGETMFTQCARSASWVLSQLPGFESIEQTVWPQKLRENFARVPGAYVERVIREDDEGQNYEALEGVDNNDAAPPKPETGRG